MEMTKQESAFLKMITVSELGEELMAIDPNGGFGVIVGSTPTAPILFSDFSDHPRKLVPLPRLGISSTAAGGFQIIERFFDSYRSQLHLSDFTPRAQQAIALTMLQETGARTLVNQGDIAGAIHLARSRWASLPGAGYGQHENSLEHLLGAYQKAFEADADTDNVPTASV